MSFQLYDTALVEKIQKWTKDINIPILKPDESTRLFRLIADNRSDKPLTLPQFMLSRDREIEILETGKQSKTFDGYTIDSNEARTELLNAIPISLSYQLDIYTITLEEASNYVRELIFNFINHPKLEIEIPYNDCKLTHNATINIESTIADNSDINEHLFADEFYRFTIRLSIQDAYLFSVPIQKNSKITDVIFRVQDKDKTIVEQESIAIDS